ncbi:S-adenosylmethionine-dependent methyltransferase Rv2258c-like [Lytechinus pictus]|uniref:S-adenosylmethionine-dependent methyltransferase Rv2258c-like n=1 Tax=Lytechinus pictus TaxID=7653 RepID=UPI0030B9DD3C
MAEQYGNETPEEFSSRIFSIVSGGLTGLSIALGVKSGLFDVLVSHHGSPLTSQELADLAGMKERYVREWLATMVTAHIVDVDESSEKYHVPSSRLESLQPGTLLGQSASLSIGIPMFSSVFSDMLEILKKDGPRGHELSTIEPFHEFDKQYGSAWYNHCFIQEFIPSHPEIEAKLESGIRMMDVGCGAGIATRLLAQKFPKSQFVGIDIGQTNVDTAKEEASHLGLKNVSYHCVDASAMPSDWEATFDYIFFFNVLHDIPRPDLVIDDAKRVMKRDGLLSVIELNFKSKVAENVGNAAAAMVSTISTFYCLPQAYLPQDTYGLGTVWGKDRIEEFLLGKGLVVKSASEVPKINEFHFLCNLS